MLKHFITSIDIAKLIKLQANQPAFGEKLSSNPHLSGVHNNKTQTKSKGQLKRFKKNIC